MVFISKTVLDSSTADEVYIPREVMCRESISDNTKLIFGVIFSECLSKMESINVRNVSKAVYALKNFSENISLKTIERECMCGTETAKNIRHELVSLIATLDIGACFYECELHYASIQKPVCRMCENGKMLYKMIDLVNTIIDRELYGDIQKHYFDDEKQVLKKYNATHSPELLNEVIDILKR